ncbi:uncharacterized protein LOC109831770 isoform X2 [Asparagus officinalis]|uniref:uncharacterized protein LOC109831770 isoform X2 n=1 Tax=Asparagus officinalis TaxID=4686 RepID=UPI00098E70C9|nr:uncharacterized protein LOC109831770 isoform X2 [Asparagus officinalis]
MPPSSEETQPSNDDGDSLSKSGDAIGMYRDETLADSILYGETQAVDGDGDDEVETQVVGGDGDDRVLGDGADSVASTYDEGRSKEDYVSSEVLQNEGSARSFAAVRTASLRASGLAAARRNPSEADNVEFKALSNNGSVRSFASVCTASLRASGFVAAQTKPSKADNVELKALLNNGSMRSFVAVRAASLRASGRAAAQSSKAADVVLSSLFNNGETHNNQDNVVGEIARVHERGASEKCTKDYHRDEMNRKNNQVVKKLLYDTESDEEESTIMPNNNNGHVYSPSSSVPDNIAGLTYIVSPVPGDLSQANALDVVNKFLVVNDLGLSQEYKSEMSTDTVKSPPTSNAKGVRILAKKTGHKSPVGKIGTFEWIDNLEDEGGGDFFTRRKDFFFGRVEQRSLSLPPIVPDAVLKDQGDEHRNYPYLTNFNHLGSRFMEHSSLMNEKAFVAETRARKNLFKDINEQPNSKSLDQQLKPTDVDRGEEGICEYCPDTQMAVEAMEPLIHENSSQAASSRKFASSTPNFEGVSTRSKKRKMLYTNSKLEVHVTSKGNSKEQKSLECTTEKTKSRRGKKDLEQSLDTKSLANKTKCSISIKGEKALRQMDEASKGEAHKCSEPGTLSNQLSLNNELIKGSVGINSTPIALRTRHLKAVRLAQKAEEDIASDYREDTNAMTNVSIHGKTKRKRSDIDSVQNAEVKNPSYSNAQDNERLDEVVKDGSPVKDVFAQSKQMIMRQTAQEFPSPLDDNIQHRTKQRNTKTAIESISETLDTAKRKRKSVCTSMVSGVRTRSSSKSSSLMPNVENALMSCSNEMTNPCSTPQLKRVVGFNNQVEVAEENAKTEKSTCENLRPTTVKDVDAVSPVCVAGNYKRTPGNESRRQSVIPKELTQLEASIPSPSPMFNTRRRKDMTSVRVLFSRHLDDDIVKQQKKVMGCLSVQLATSISDATHFVADNFVRTRNMLEAMAMGKLVVTHMWLESCGQASCFTDEKKYILRDVKKEIEIGFSMPVSLARAFQNPLLQGRRVYITPNIQPRREVMSKLVKAAHGQPIERIGRSMMKDDKIPDDLLVLSCEEDYSTCIPFLEKGAEIFRSELLLNGIVIQKLEFQRHRLFLDHVKKTRSTIWLRRATGNEFLPVSKCA